MEVLGPMANLAPPLSDVLPWPMLSRCGSDPSKRRIADRLVDAGGEGEGQHQGQMQALGRSQLGHVAIQASISLSSPVFRPSGRKLAVTELLAKRAITSSLKPNVARRAS